MEDNLFAPHGYYWWIGCVEDRMDPLKLGRCRVRIIGYHIDNKKELPTDDLPWAMPMQPILSAANSGKGDAPVGPLEGTWVMGFFADGNECQQPVMLGTIGGIPATTNSAATEPKNLTNAKRDNNGNIIYDQNGNPIINTPAAVDSASTASKSISSTLPPMGQDAIQSLMNSIAFRESGSRAGGTQNYGVVNIYGYAGKYQFGVAALQTLGYVKTPLGRTTALTNGDLNDPNIWTGKNGVQNFNDFLTNKNNVQETAMFENLKFNYAELNRLGVIDANSRITEVGGYLSTAHLLGAGGAKDLSLGINGADGKGTRANTYYNLGVAAVGNYADSTVAAIQPVAVATNSQQTNKNINLNLVSNWAGALNNPSLGTPAAYADPNSVYPTLPYLNRADTNKLATHNDNLSSTLVIAKEKNRTQKVQTANNASGEWAEPPSPYNAKYPYNHVKETESGHVVEFDDTPNAERIQIWHRTGTYVEIDKNGTVTYKVKGENYELYSRNNRIDVKGNMDVTVDGAKTLLVKHALDVEVLGKTTINIKNDADLQVAGTFNVKAKNINIEAQQNLNIRTGSYFNNFVGGQLNYTVRGDFQTRVSGDYDLDASEVNINSGTANPTAASATNLRTIFSTGLTGNGFNATGLTPLPVDIANPLNAVGKGLPAVLGNIDGGSLNNLFTAGGLGGIVNNLGLNGLDTILAQSTNIGSIANVLEKAGLPNPGQVYNLVATQGYAGLNSLLSQNGLGSLEQILQGQGINLDSTLGNVLGNVQSQILQSIKSSNIIPSNLLDEGQRIIDNFVNKGVGILDITTPKFIQGVAVDATEFKSWTDFPPAAQLSRFFTLGDLTTRVQEVSMQAPLIAQAGLEKYDIISNLKALAVNTLDPIRTQYPNTIISDAFRPTADNLNQTDDVSPLRTLLNTVQSNVPASVASLIELRLAQPSPHNLGQAANLQFKGSRPEDYFGIAQWIKNNLAYDQLRLEYTTFGTREPWITVSYAGQNRAPTQVDKVVTCMNGQVIANYLVDLTS